MNPYDPYNPAHDPPCETCGGTGYVYYLDCWECNPQGYHGEEPWNGKFLR